MSLLEVALLTLMVCMILKSGSDESESELKDPNKSISSGDFLVFFEEGLYLHVSSLKEDLLLRLLVDELGSFVGGSGSSKAAAIEVDV
jgi:hypothetical protein